MLMALLFWSFYVELTIKTLAGVYLVGCTLFLRLDYDLLAVVSWIIFFCLFHFSILHFYLEWFDYLHIYKVSCVPPDPSDMTDPPCFLSQHVDLMSRAGQPQPIRARAGELVTNGRRAGDMWPGSRGRDTSHFLSQCPVSGACGEWDTGTHHQHLITERRYRSGNKTPPILILPPLHIGIIHFPSEREVSTISIFCRYSQNI